MLFLPTLIGAHCVTAVSLALCQDASTETATEQQRWSGCKHNTCAKAPAEAEKTEKPESSNCILRTDRTFLPLATKILNVSVFLDMTKNEALMFLKPQGDKTLSN